MAVAAYDPFGSPVLDEPSVAYAHLLAERPVHYFADFDPPFYTLSRHADVQRALRDIDTYSSEFGQGPRFTPPAGLLSNPPQHTFFRNLVQQAFSPRAIEAMRGRVEELAEELLDECLTRRSLRPTSGASPGATVDSCDSVVPRSRKPVGEWDLHDAFAFPLPVIVIAEMLGVPADELHLFKRWSDASVAAMGAADPSAYESELVDLANYILARIRERRAAPGRGDLIDRLARAEQDGKRLADEEILSVVNQLLVGGNETTTSLITNAVWRLLECPALWRRVVAEPGLVDRALEESLRFDPPVLGLYRSTTRAVELHGVRIPKDAKVMLHYAAANRDPEVWNDPDTFSLDRPAQRHLSFGLGVHFCLGAQLARLEAGVALRTLVTRCPDLRLVNSGQRIVPWFLWGRRHLPVAEGITA